MRKTVDIMGVHIDSTVISEAVDTVKSFLNENGAKSVFTPNSEILINANKDPFLKNVLNSADLCIPDGAGVLLAARILGLDLPEKVSGVDLVKALFSSNFERKIKYYILGAKPGIAEEAAAKIEENYHNAIVVGCKDGYFKDADEDQIIDAINASGADILLVGLGVPKQEIWIHKHKDRLNVKECFGIGGSIDIFAGRIKLAPEIMRRAGFEWLFRLYKEPWRYKRMLNLPKFILNIISIRMGISRG